MKEQTPASKPRQARMGGVTLAETLITLSILVIVMSLGILQFRAPIDSAGAQGMAQAFAAQLTAARKRAMSQHTTVAVCLPSAAGTRPHSQAFYVLEGNEAPTVTQVFNLGSDFPNSYLVSGVWGTAANVTLNPPQGYSSDTGPNMNLANWLGAPNTNYGYRDYTIAFTYDGKVQTNDLPWVGGQLQILACSGCTWGSALSIPGTPKAGGNSAVNFALSDLYEANTICISETGNIWITPGAVQANAGVISATPQTPGPPAAPPVVGGTPNTAPTILSVTTVPVQSAGNYTAVIPASGYVTFVIRALDSDPNEHLSCSLSAISTNTANISSGGNFSQNPGAVRMYWDPTDCNTTGYPNGCWKAVWVWAPPGSPTDPNYSPPGFDFKITGSVTDDHGVSASFGGTSVVTNGPPASALGVHVVNEGHLVFSAAYAGTTQLFRMDPTATTVTPLFPTGSLTSSNLTQTLPVASSDGSQLIYLQTAGMSSGGNWPCSIFQCDYLGNNNHLVVNLPYYVGNPGASAAVLSKNISSLSISGDGTQYCAFISGTNETIVGPVSGTGSILSLGFASASNSNPSWSPATGGNTAGWIAFVDSNNTVAVCNANDAQYIGTAPYGYANTTAAFTPPSLKELSAAGSPQYLSWNGDGSMITWWDSGVLKACPVSLSGSTFSGGSVANITGAPPTGSPFQFNSTSKRVINSAPTGYINIADYAPAPTNELLGVTSLSLDLPGLTLGSVDGLTWTQ